MALNDDIERLEPVIRSKARRDVARLDYLRDLKAVIDGGLALKIASFRLRVPEAELLRDLAAAEDAGVPRPGFSGATPVEIAQRGAAGQITPDQVIDELATWDYVPTVEPESVGSWDLDPMFQPRGTDGELFEMVSDGLLDPDTYSAIVTRRSERVGGDETSPAPEEQVEGSVPDRDVDRAGRGRGGTAAPLRSRPGGAHRGV